MSIQIQYEFLESRPRSSYKQLWVKGRHIRAEVLYRYTVGPEPESAEQVAKEFDLPVGAVLEAIRLKKMFEVRATRGSWIRVTSLVHFTIRFP